MVMELSCDESKSGVAFGVEEIEEGPVQAVERF
jgi:hypothetical protein